MREVNSKITDKIHELIDSDAPPEIFSFFDRLLEHQIREEAALYTPAEMSQFYSQEIIKAAKNDSVIKFIKEKNNE